MPRFHEIVNFNQERNSWAIDLLQPNIDWSKVETNKNKNATLGMASSIGSSNYQPDQVLET